MYDGEPVYSCVQSIVPELIYVLSWQFSHSSKIVDIGPNPKMFLCTYTAKYM